ncbi:MAG: hypothetical protein HONBIEJF_02383 [Fimbriimonadaceae bacterium]|nr:hypothetical protein [Fimbriimonadaceae bacterium]
MALNAGPGHKWQGGPSSVNPYSFAKQSSLTLIHWKTVGGLEMDFTIHHNSMAAYGTGTLGTKWSHSYGTRLLRWSQSGTDRIAVVFADHRIGMLAKSGATWVPQDGYRYQLTEVGANLELRMPNGIRLTFQPVGGNLIPKRYRLASLTSKGVSATMTYDAANRLVRVSEPSGRALRLNYVLGKLSSLEFLVANVPQRVWQFAYAGNNLIAVQLPPVTGPQGLEFHSYAFSYNPSANIISVTDPVGLSQQFSYSGNEISAIQEPGNSSTERTTFARQGNLRVVTDPLGHSKTFEYDASSRLVRVQDELGFNAFLEYSDPDDPYALSAVVKPSGDRYEFDVNSRGYAVGWKDPAGNRWDYSYDSRNNLVQVLAPLVTDAWGNVESGRHRTVYIYDSQDRMLQVRRYISPGSFRTTSYGYDGLGNLISITNPSNRTWTYGRDAYGNATQVQTPTGRVSRQIFDTAAQTAGFTVPNAFIDGLGQRTDFLRDEWGRLTRIDYPASFDTEYQYDGRDRLIRTVGSEGTTLYSYNPRGLVASIDCPPFNLTYDYDAAYRLILSSDTSISGQRTVQYAYSPRGQVVSINDGFVTHFSSYDLDGRIAFRQLGNGASSYYSYSGGRLVSQTHYDVNQNPMQSFLYRFQADGRLVESSEMFGAVVRYGYDFFGRVVREERSDFQWMPYDFQWSYDIAGNRAAQIWNGNQTTYSYDNDNRIIDATSQLGTDFYWHDPAGRLIQRIQGPEDLRFSYDEAGRLRAIDEWNGSFQQPYAAYDYDALGRRSRRYRFFGGSLYSHSSSLYDGSHLVREDTYVQGWPAFRMMLWGHGLLSVQEPFSSLVDYGAQDIFGNLRTSSNYWGQGTGLVQIYNAFGQTVYGQPPPGGYGFLSDRGVRTDGDAGLMFNGNSYHDPTIGATLNASFGSVASHCPYCGGGGTHKPDCHIVAPLPPLVLPGDFGIPGFDFYPLPGPLEGDTNLDGDVDAADYLVWRRNVGCLLPPVNEWPFNEPEDFRKLIEDLFEAPDPNRSERDEGMESQSY